MARTPNKGPAITTDSLPAEVADHVHGLQEVHSKADAMVMSATYDSLRCRVCAKFPNYKEIKGIHRNTFPRQGRQTFDCQRFGGVLPGLPW
jgi:hypothetical protein